MCRLVHHPEFYLKPWEEIPHSYDLKIEEANKFQQYFSKTAFLA
jgi:hypothetical protein